MEKGTSIKNRKFERAEIFCNAIGLARLVHRISAFPTLVLTHPASHSARSTCSATFQSAWFREIQENLGDFPATTSKKEKNVVAANGGAKGMTG